MRPFYFLFVPAWILAFPALGGEWVVDGGKSTVTFSGISNGMAFKGEITDFHGRGCFTRDNPETAHGVLTLDITTATTGIGKRDDIMKAPEWLNSKEFPSASFSLSGLEQTEGAGNTALGNLTIRGEENPVRLPVHMNFRETEVIAEGEFTLDRRNYNVGEGRWGETPRWVSYEITISFSLSAFKSGKKCNG